MSRISFIGNNLEEETLTPGSGRVIYTKPSVYLIQGGVLVGMTGISIPGIRKLALSEETLTVFNKEGNEVRQKFPIDTITDVKLDPKFPRRFFVFTQDRGKGLLRSKTHKYAYETGSDEESALWVQGIKDVLEKHFQKLGMESPLTKRNKSRSAKEKDRPTVQSRKRSISAPPAVAPLALRRFPDEEEDDRANSEYDNNTEGLPESDAELERSKLQEDELREGVLIQLDSPKVSAPNNRKRLDSIPEEDWEAKVSPSKQKEKESEKHKINDSRASSFPSFLDEPVPRLPSPPGLIGSPRKRRGRSLNPSWKPFEQQSTNLLEGGASDGRDVWGFLQ